MAKSNKLQVLEAYRDYIQPHEWAYIGTVQRLANLELTTKQMSDSAYQASLVGQMEKHETESNTYRLTQDGLAYLANPPHQAMAGKRKRRSKTKSKTQTRTTASSNSGLEFGSLLEVVAIDGKGAYLARNMETGKAYKVSDL